MTTLKTSLRELPLKHLTIKHIYLINYSNINNQVYTGCQLKNERSSITRKRIWISKIAETCDS